ncbi:hypothetical protein [Microcoleus sp. FACHB-1515]|uniref:hypothetical protein n=1 Tax=Cyanophyceae TaxID=3028117 RepID=UPI001F557B12|nr:hypothetical protein [Microcoleus sp. FACHB-1515]
MRSLPPNCPTLFRIQHDDSLAWIFVCRDCWQTVSENNPHYVYGGTWKAKKRH